MPAKLPATLTGIVVRIQAIFSAGYISLRLPQVTSKSVTASSGNLWKASIVRARAESFKDGIVRPKERLFFFAVPINLTEITTCCIEVDGIFSEPNFDKKVEMFIDGCLIRCPKQIHLENFFTQA